MTASRSTSRPIAQAVRIAFGVSVLCAAQLPPAWAAESAAVARKPYRVATGPLGEALMSFAGQAGVSVSLDMDQVRGLSTPGLEGEFSVDEGFGQLLAGSGLRARRVGASYKVEAAPLVGQPSAAPAVTELTPVAVDARLDGELIPSTRQVTRLAREEIDTLGKSSDSLATLLSKAVPGMADSSHTITDFGQTLRGRNMLVLVDGVPLNTNRDSSRKFASINPADIEQIEVLRGSSAIYGSGGAGGVVSIRTRRPSGEPRAETTATGLVPLSKPGSAGLGAEIQHYLSGGGEVVDYSISLGARRQGGSFDAKGERIAPEPSQGDLFDSNTYSVAAKLGFKVDENQRLQFSASRYDAKQDTDYASDPSVGVLPPGSATARGVKGLQLADQNRVVNSMIGLDYEHRDLAGSALNAQLYYRDFFTRFAPADVRNVSVRGGNVDQIMQNSSVLGGRVTIKTPLGASRRTQVVWGVDFNRERSDMPIDVFDAQVYDASNGLIFRKTGRQVYMPPVTTSGIGGFAQLQHRFSDRWSAEGGVRYDRASASFDDFIPLSQSKVENPQGVEGGKVRYSEWIYNAGLVFTPVKDHDVYASYSQGFELPDIGLQVRNATPSFNIGNSNLQAVKTDTVEIGWRGRFGGVLANVNVFHSGSDLGAVQSFNNGLRLIRTKERVRGLEAGFDYFSDDDRWSAGGSLALMKGRELPQDATSYQGMTGYRIPPLKLTAYVEYRPSERWSHRLQATAYRGKDYRLDGVAGFGRRETSGYATFDLVSRWKIDEKNQVVMGIENLLNHHYYPLYSQLLRSNTNTSRLPASGAVLRVSYSHVW